MLGRLGPEARLSQPEDRPGRKAGPLSHSAHPLPGPRNIPSHRAYRLSRVRWRSASRVSFPSPFPSSKRIAHRGIWVEPSLMAEIEYRAKSAEGRNRLGIRVLRRGLFARILRSEG